MFTGIIETMGIINGIFQEEKNVRLLINSPISNELKIDQSVAHNGVCLTVVKVSSNQHEVVAVDETMQKTNLGELKIGDEINLERCLKIGDRLDGHMVQGHVDGTAVCVNKIEMEGSWQYDFLLNVKLFSELIVEKGSVAVNGVSLTAFNVKANQFSVAIIPYTFQHTTFNHLKVNDTVNIEMDVIGKYVFNFTKAHLKS